MRLLNSLQKRRKLLAILVIGTCALAPIAAGILDQPYYINLFSRLMIWAIAAISLNLLLGYGGMISFGHSLYLGIGYSDRCRSVHCTNFRRNQSENAWRLLHHDYDGSHADGLLSFDQYRRIWQR